MNAWAWSLTRARVDRDQRLENRVQPPSPDRISPPLPEAGSILELHPSMTDSQKARTTSEGPVRSPRAVSEIPMKSRTHRSLQTWVYQFLT